MKKRILCVCIALIVCFQSVPTAYAVPQDDFQSATRAVCIAFDEIVLALCDSDIFMSRITSINDLMLGDPFIVYHADEEGQNEVIYYPIVDGVKKKIVYMIEAIYYRGDYVINTLDSFVDLLNEVDYVNNECVVYLSSGTIYVETETGRISALEYYVQNNSEREIITEHIESDTAAISNESFDNLLFNEKTQIISERENELTECEEYQWASASDQLEAKNHGSLTLYKPQGQYSYGMCWASCVATVYNYVYMSVITGFEVCARMNKGYDDGANAYEIQDALAKYNIDYGYVRRSSLTWSQIKTNIDNDMPIIAVCFPYNVSEGHAVTIYGYTGSSSSDGVVRYWNSNLNSGTGGYASFEFGSGNGVFSSGDGYPYFWEDTVSCY